MIASTKGRYALRVMIDLAEHPTEGYLPLREIARRQEISEKYLELILRLLVRQRLVTGLRGKGGGYRLSRPPEAYTVGEILRCAEESLSPVTCLEAGSPPCHRAGECRTLPMWKQLDKLVSGFLDSVTLADLMAGEPPAPPTAR